MPDKQQGALMQVSPSIHQTVFKPDVARARATMAQCALYAPTPLITVKAPKGSGIYIKDETGRLGLGAFKGLGAIYAVAQLLAGLLGQQRRVLWPAMERLGAAEKAALSGVTLVCASAGNHGMAVAKAAQIFGVRAKVFLPESAPESFARRLAGLGAEVVIAGTTYEDACAAAANAAKGNKVFLVADFSIANDETTPALVMEGYQILASELERVFAGTGIWPTHVYLQAGVGSFAAATARYIRLHWPMQPTIIIVEPDVAPCLRASAAAGRLTVVADPRASLMHRLDCKVPSSLAVDVLAHADVHYHTVSDEVAVRAVQALHGSGMVTTPSGAAGYAAILSDVETGRLGGNDRPLCVVTEGAERVRCPYS